MSLKKLKPELKFIAAAMIIVIVVFVLSLFLKSPSIEYVEPVVERSGLQNPNADIEGFERDCINDVLQDAVIVESCASVRAIAGAYKVDVRAYLEEEKSFMIMTARRIVRGEILDMDDYKRCIQQNRCVYMSFVKDVAGKEAAPRKSKEGRKQALFWHLINDGRFIPALCPYMKGCRALYKTGAINFGKK